MNKYKLLSIASYRFMDLLPDANIVRDTQKELDAVIQDGVVQLTRLLRNSESGNFFESVTRLNDRLLTSLIIFLPHFIHYHFTTN